MEIFKNRKLHVSLNDNVLTISEKTGCACMKETIENTCDLTDIIAMEPDHNGSNLAIAAKKSQFYLKMNPQAVNLLMQKWEPVRVSFIEKQLFEKKNVTGFLTNDGYLLIKEKIKDGFLCCSSITLNLFCISVDDIVLIDVHKKFFGGDTVFLSTEDHAIEISKLQPNEAEEIIRIIKEKGTQIENMKSYRRSFRLSLTPETEYIYTTDKGIAHYYKRGRNDSEFTFQPWDKIIKISTTKGCLRKYLLVISGSSISTINKFFVGDVMDIKNHVEMHLQNNAGDTGTMFGYGLNKVYVTDTHVICIGRKEFKTLPKPYENGRLVKKCLLTSTVDLNGFKVKESRYAWKKCCCGHGPFFDAVTASPTRRLKGSAEEHRF